MNENDTFRGASVLRKEDRRLVTGQGSYVGDLTADGMVTAEFVRSNEAHGILESIDIEDAVGTPGVVAVFTAADFELPDIPSATPPVPIETMPRPVLVRHRTRYVGEAVAMVVAEDPQTAVDAAGLVWADVDPLPAVIDPKVAGTAPPLHDGTTSNLVERFDLGDANDDREDEVEVTVEVTNQRLAPVPIEALAVLALPTGDGVHLHVGHQSPHRLKGQLNNLLDFPVEVFVPDVGGGFGMKARLYPEYIAVAVAARTLGRPVRWLQSRREHFLTGTHGRDMIHTITLGGDRSGRIRRAHVDILASVGAYPHVGAQVATFARLVAQGLYDIEHVTLSSTTVVTNQAPIAPYRGAGRPEAAYAIERAVDAFARAAGQDPFEVRRRNVFRSDALPHRTATGATYDSGDYRAALDAAARLLDLDELREEQAHRGQADEPLLGIGFGAFIERAGGPADSSEYARVDLTPAGTIEVRTGSTSNGQGHETVWAQVAGQVFDLEVSQVEVIAGDTTRVARGFGSTASRSAQIGASGVWRTAHRVRAAAAGIAAQMLEVSVEDLRLEQGVFRVAGVPGSEVTLPEVAQTAAAQDVPLTDEEWYSPGAQTFPYGVHAAVVEVEPETGEVHLLKFVAVDDCGNVLNPMIVEGQTHGSVAQGIGQAMYEGIVYDPEGQLTTSTLMDYLVPRAADIPPIVTDRIVSPAPSNPLGAKGSGEGGCIGAPPAIVNAVLDALAPLGVKTIDMPLHPQRVWKAIREASGR